MRLEKACQKLWPLENQLAALVYCGDGSPAQPPGYIAIANGKRVDNSHISFRRVGGNPHAPLEANADLHVLPEQYTWDIDVLPGALAAAVGKGVALTLPVQLLQWFRRSAARSRHMRPALRAKA